MQSIRRFLSIYVVICLVSVLTAPPASPQSSVCVTSVGGLAGSPNLDGVVSGDPGWNNAVQLNLSGDLGATTATKVLLGTDGTNLWLGLIVSAPAIDQYTTFVLAFSANDGHPENDWRLHIEPFFNNGKLNSNNTPELVQVWRNSTSTTAGDMIPWDMPNSSSTTATGSDWEDSVNNIQASFNGTNHWELEFKIPLVTSSSSNGGFCLTCGTSSPSTFSLYMNTLDTGGGTIVTPAPPEVAQDVWPPCNAGVICSSIYDPAVPTDISQLTPPPSAWGTGAVWSSGATNPPLAACTGVSLKSFPQVGVLNQGSSTPSTTVQADLNAITQEHTVADCNNMISDSTPLPSNPTNTLFATPHNSSTNTAHVSVTFRLADFGIPATDPSLGGSGLFPPLGSPVPAGCDPTRGAGQCAGVNNNPTQQLPINPGATASTSDFNATWQLNLKQTCLFKYALTYGIAAHQCIQVVMDSTDPNTVLLNHSVEQNLNFGQASTFTQSAAIYGSQGNVPSPTRFLLSLDTDEDGPIVTNRPPGQTTTGVPTRTAASAVQNPPIPRFRDQDLAAVAKQQLGSQTTNLYQWIARGYVYTGTKIIIHGQQFQWVKRAGDFGYVTGHTGEITGWSTKFQGSALQEINPYLYTAVVSPSQKATVTTTITAETPTGGGTPAGKFAVFLDLGANFPQGTFSTLFSNGFSLNAGLEYIATTHFSVEGIFGYHYVPIKGGGNGDIYQFSGDAKWYFLTGNLRPFINGGIGGYAFSPGSTYFGGNVGGGVLYTFTPHWGIQGSYNFHAVNAPTTAQFSTLQGGVRYVF